MNRKKSPNPFATIRQALMIVGIVLVMLSLVQSGNATSSLYNYNFLTIKLNGNFDDWPASASGRKSYYH